MQSRLPTVAVFIGAAMVTLGLVYHYGDADTKQEVMYLIPVLGGIAFLLAGISGAIATLLDQGASLRKYPWAVQGTCVDHERRGGSRRQILRCPVYEIMLDGEKVTMKKNVYTNMGVPDIGKVRTLYIDREHLESYAEPIADRYARILQYALFGAFVIAGGIILAVLQGR